MPRPPRPWFRFYSEAIENRKLQSLPDDLFKLYINLLCIANRATPRGNLPSVVDIAFALRTDPLPLLDQLAQLRRRKFLNGGWQAYQIHDWQEWQPDSDANLTPGRSNKNEVPRSLERGKNALRPRKERGSTAQRRGEEEIEGEGEENAPAHPFALSYAQKYAQRTAGRRPPVTEHAAAIAIEREYGSDACIELATDLDWQKHPNYMRPILQERRDGKPERVERNGSYGAAPRPVEDAWPPAYGNRPKFILDPYGAGDGSEGEHPAGDEGGLEVRVGAAGEGRDSDAAVRDAAAL